MVDLSPAILSIAPHANAATWSAALGPPMTSAGITTPNRIAMFIGQIAIESAYFDRTEEDLWYSSAQHIFETFPHAFANAAEAVPYIGQPEMLGNRAYAGINGNDQPGDGYLFRGRGLIQITGRDNCTAFAKAMGRPLDDLFLAWMTQQSGAAASACWFWNMRSLNALADAWDISGITRRINPGMDGAAAREMACASVRAALELTQIPAIPAASSIKTAPEEITPEPTADQLDSLYNPGA